MIIALLDIKMCFYVFYLCTEYFPSTLPLWHVPYLICTYVIVRV